MLAWPTTVGLYVTVQLADVGPAGDRLQVAAGVKVPVLFVVKVTEPEGVVAPLVEVSDTVAEQREVPPTTIGVAQLTSVLVG
jgi:hypothetical protein